MIIDFKLPPEKPITRLKPRSSLTIPCGCLLLSVCLSGILLLTAALLSLTTTSLHTLHMSLLLRHSPLSEAFLPWPTDLLENEATTRPRWTRERLVRRLPQCIIIGVRKSGTRALIEFLNLHPRIRKASDEIHYFDEEQNYGQGQEWYRRKMPFSYADQITVEKSPAYFITRYVPQRIKAMNSTIKLVLVVKNPITRVISDYTQTRTNRMKKGKNFLSFEDTVLTPDGLVDVSYKPIRVSLYHKHLVHWLKVFSRDQLLIVDGDMLVADPVLELEKVEGFLGLDRWINSTQFHFNATKGFYCIRDSHNQEQDRCLSKTKGRAHPHVPGEVLEKLSKFFRPHNERFFQEIGRRFDW